MNAHQHLSLNLEHFSNNILYILIGNTELKRLRRAFQKAGSAKQNIFSTKKLRKKPKIVQIHKNI